MKQSTETRPMKQTSLPGFARAEMIGLNIIRMDKKTEGQSSFLEIREFGVFEKKNGKVIDSAEVLDLATGEEGTLWLDGSMKYQLKQYAEEKGLPFKVEIQFTGKEFADVTIDGQVEEKEINTYKFWALKEADMQSDS